MSVPLLAEVLEISYTDVRGMMPMELIGKLAHSLIDFWFNHSNQPSIIVLKIY